MHDILVRGLRVLRASFVSPLVRMLPAWISPNHLTILRLLLAPVVGVFLLQKAWGSASMVYLLAVSTDALDGELARVRGRVSPLGARLDPTVDKVLHGVVFLLFFSLSPVLIGLILFCDVVLFLLGAFLAFRKQTQHLVSANVYGKSKFIFQALSIFLLLAESIVFSPSIAFFAHTALFLSLCLAIASLSGYFRELWRTNIVRSH